VEISTSKTDVETIETYAPMVVNQPFVFVAISQDISCEIAWRKIGKRSPAPDNRKQVTFSDKKSESETKQFHRSTKTQQEENADGESSYGEVSARKLGTAAMLRVPLKVAGNCVIAIVDTAAEVTILSEKIYEIMDPKPKKVQELNMHV